MGPRTSTSLLLDHDLPDLDGVTFLSRLTEALKCWAQDYLVKGSFTSEFLRKAVDEAIERVKIRRELEARRQELERPHHDARDADRRKDEFLAMLAHVLRLAIVTKIWNHDARIAYTGPGVIALAESYRPRVVLLDIGLPGMDGYAVARPSAPGPISPAPRSSP